MTEAEKKEIQEQLIKIDDSTLELWGGYYEDEEEMFSVDYDDAQYKINKAVKFIREKLSIPEPKE